MNEPYAKRLAFDMEPRDLLRLLQSHAKAKAGPFSWKHRHEGQELGLFLIVRKEDKNGFEGTVSTILYRKPGASLLAKEGEPVATLQGTRVREGQTIVLMKCPEPKATGWLFVNFALGMEQLQQEVAKSPTGAESEPTIQRETLTALPRRIPPSPERSPKAKEEGGKPEEPTQEAKDEAQKTDGPTQAARDETQKTEEPTEEVRRELEKAEVPAPTLVEAKPWLQIPDSGWDRIAVRLVHQGYSSAEIARKIEKGIVPKTVENRLSALRAQYGPEIVPYRKKPTRNRDKLG